MFKKFGRRSAMMTLAAIVGTLGLVLTAAPAQATTTTLSGPISECNFTLKYGVARTNSNAQNAVSFRPTNTGGCGAPLTLALRNSSGSTFARGTANSGKTVAIKADNGKYWVGAGTFYINAGINGACGSSTCAQGHSWSASFTYNVRWTP
ncbi:MULTISPECIES: hypothetical protein [Curtobacterium]|uniref:hypothetical protein n=1 Tax=Curtobacterium TaxID=2034 RepID=UPI000AC70F38|nr:MULTISPECIES: hypothetical protein [Curtobacterium]VXB06023.1 conserved exported hypothetical protein [Curtobacterium sp. 8I-2]